MKKSIAILLASVCLMSFSKPEEAKSIMNESTIKTIAAECISTDKTLLEKGIHQCAFLWRAEDGDEAQFTGFVKKFYAKTPQEKEELFTKLSGAYEKIFGSFGDLSSELTKPTILKGFEPTEVDYILSTYNPMGNLYQDFFTNKLAFITILNFPNFTLEEKNSQGKNWSRLDWAYARMGDLFTSRIPAEVVQKEIQAYSDCEKYIADYNIMMGHVLTDDGRRLFPEDMVLLSHWNLRDELKSNYADIPNNLEKQEIIYKIMERIVTQEIPIDIVNDGSYDWAPYSNKSWKDGKEVTLKPEGAERYANILKYFHAFQEADPYYAQQPTAIIRNFEGGMEVTSDEIEDLFVKLISSKEVKQVSDIIKARLGRDLRPFDIWYDGFKGRASIAEDKLTEQTRKLYPTPDAFWKGMPQMLQNLGFTKEYSEYLADKIRVEPARGSGHAQGASGKGYKSYLRTRIGDKGMDYKGYNIAVHEFGHNVEQTIDTYDIDYYTLSGVPNNAFTEALAFIFQKRDLQLLGYESKYDDNSTLDIFWGMYEIMGVSLVDMYTWRWLYDNPAATPEQLKTNCLRIAREVWNKYYEPVLGTHDSPILAIYSHMVNTPMYLPSYPFGSIIEYQIEEYFSKLPDPSKIGPEIERIWKTGRLTPQAWMNEAVGANISIAPILSEIDRIVGRH